MHSLSTSALKSAPDYNSSIPLITRSTDREPSKVLKCIYTLSAHAQLLHDALSGVLHRYILAFLSSLFVLRFVRDACDIMEWLLAHVFALPPLDAVV